MHWRDAQPSTTKRMRLAVIGEGPDSDLLPVVLAAGFRSNDTECEIDRLDCTMEEFADCVTHLRTVGYKAISVGNPHKPVAAKLAKDFFVVQHALGVANALSLGANVYAQNTEVPAFARLIGDLKPGSALVMGSGRAARSAVMGLFDKGWHVRLWNRSIVRTKPFVSLFVRYGKVEASPQADPSGCGLIVNATALGRRAGEQPPVLWNHARPNTTAIDFVFRNVSTEFLRSASRQGFKTIDGRELLVEQAAVAVEWWVGKPADRQPMLEAAGIHKHGPEGTV